MIFISVGGMSQIQEINLCFIAKATASVRLLTPNLESILLTCVLIVGRERFISLAIFGLLSPETK